MKMLPAMTSTQSLKSAPVGTLGSASGAASCDHAGRTTSSCSHHGGSPLLPGLRRQLVSSDGGDLPSFGAVRGDGAPQRDRVGLVQGGLAGARPGDGRRRPALVVVAGCTPASCRSSSFTAPFRLRMVEPGAVTAATSSFELGVRLEERLRVLLRLLRSAPRPARRYPACRGAAPPASPRRTSAARSPRPVVGVRATGTESRCQAGVPAFHSPLALLYGVTSTRTSTLPVIPSGPTLTSPGSAVLALCRPAPFQPTVLSRPAARSMPTAADRASGASSPQVRYEVANLPPTARASSRGKLASTLAGGASDPAGRIQERTPVAAASSSTTTTRPRRKRRPQLAKDDSDSVVHGTSGRDSSSLGGGPVRIPFRTGLVAVAVLPSPRRCGGVPRSHQSSSLTASWTGPRRFGGRLLESDQRSPLGGRLSRLRHQLISSHPSKSGYADGRSHGGQHCADSSREDTSRDLSSGIPRALSGRRRYSAHQPLGGRGITVNL